ncbi:hypothetical protein KDD17_09260 [Sulfitobacter albidus]|uniref:Uncharacterized protein n=1 Tax=Sulfitobacter albidus TaxID=2829501 RepID=A0A975JB64_9RHOB|nr:hypothetical protein [Sulfitobacter albidus]QUJ75211.1 hypothetical protein KDD17_09260 [Sulfitobacter albidus]
MKPHCLIFALGLGACTTFPQLDHTVTPALEEAAYPALVPLAPIVAQATTPGVVPAQANAALDARISRLRARAARLRGSVLTGRERQRLAQGLQ